MLHFAHTHIVDAMVPALFQQWRNLSLSVMTCVSIRAVERLSRTEGKHDRSDLSDCIGLTIMDCSSCLEVQGVEIWCSCTSAKASYT
jgi:hypothetical protein